MTDKRPREATQIPMSVSVPQNVIGFLAANRRAFMFTLRSDGSPTGHPVSMFSGGGLFVNMYTASFKARNLKRDDRVCSVVTTPSVTPSHRIVVVRGKARPLSCSEALDEQGPVGLVNARSPQAEGLSDVRDRIRSGIRTIFTIVSSETGFLRQIRRPSQVQREEYCEF